MKTITDFVPAYRVESKLGQEAFPNQLAAIDYCRAQIKKDPSLFNQMTIRFLANDSTCTM